VGDVVVRSSYCNRGSQMIEQSKSPAIHFICNAVSGDST
jgi:hypothetical protein